MSKEIENEVCQICESTYKLIYDVDETSGYSKFCPFCGEEAHGDGVDEELETFEE